MGCASVLITALCLAAHALALGGVYDIVIYGATPAGISAAVAAAKANSSVQVALVTPDPFIGGMVCAGGIGLRDIGNLDTISNTSLQYYWAMLNAANYGVDYPVWQPDNYIGNESFWQILNEYSDNIAVFQSQPLIFEDGSVVKDGTRITAIATGSSMTEATWWNATIFIDASYDADIVLQSGCSYTFGRESRETYNESYAGVQPYTTFGQFIVEVNPYLSNGMFCLNTTQIFVFVQPLMITP
jgi:hypothetical protein